MNIVMRPSDAINLFNELVLSEHPVDLRFASNSNTRLQVFVDGNPTPHTLHLYTDGTWVLGTEINV